ncbi:MAG: glutamate racemase [Comamonas sp.]|nr:glutamate racemase [Comamonas sp.]
MHSLDSLPTAATGVIGVFDSGIGGLSILQALRQALPGQRLLYLADSAYAPYGERGAYFVQQRSLQIADFLQQRQMLQALVVACNTATTAAITHLRQAWPLLPIVGVEPAIKPAAQASTSGHIAVLATRGTLQSQRFAQLVQCHAQALQVQVHAVACDGLAAAIEASTQPDHQHTAAPAQSVQALCAQFVQAAHAHQGAQGPLEGQIDQWVLGCTHYIFAMPYWRQLLAPEVGIWDTGAAVARQTRRILGLGQGELPELSDMGQGAPQSVQLLTTGSLPALQAAAQRWLQLPPEVCQAVTLPMPQKT